MAGYVASQLYTFSTLFPNLKEQLAPLKVHRTQTARLDPLGGIPAMITITALQNSSRTSSFL